MSSKLGVSSYMFYWGILYLHLSAEQLIEKTAELDLRVLQICDNLPLIGLTVNQLDSLREIGYQKNVTLEVGTRGFDQDELHTYIGIARRLGSNILRFVPWSGKETLSKLSVKTLVDFLNPLLKDCENNKVIIALENHSELADEDLVKIVGKINSPYLRICLDTANSTGLLQKPLDTVRLLAPSTISLHLKDFVVTKRAGKGYMISGAPLGKGWLDIPAVFAALERQHRHPSVLLELWVDPCKSESETLQKEEEWIRQSVDYAKLTLKPNLHKEFDIQ
jgi:3-oxoisoapionate decarboxylase